MGAQAPSMTAFCSRLDQFLFWDGWNNAPNPPPSSSKIVAAYEELGGHALGMRSLAWGGPCDTDTAGDVQWLSENDLALEYKNRFLNRIDRTMAGNTLRMFPWHVCLQSITTTKEVC